jgi:hypothetical protein
VTLELAFDQTRLAPLASELAAILEQYPLVATR